MHDKSKLVGKERRGEEMDSTFIPTDLSITPHIKTPFFKSPTCHAEDVPANLYISVRNGSCQGKEGSQEQRPWKADES